MATGYLVNMGTDQTLWAGDSISTTPTEYNGATSEAYIGSGSWTVTGIVDGQQVTNATLGGAYYLGLDASGVRQIYFVPDATSVQITSATVYNPPVMTLAGEINGTGGGDNQVGTDNPNHMWGNDGNDTMSGGGVNVEADTDVMHGGNGNDYMSGNGGMDRLEGGAGHDYLSGGYGTDIADYNGGTAGINVRTANGLFTLTHAGLGVDTLDGIDGFIGTNFNDTLTGFNNDGIDPDGSVYTNYIDGAGGNDYIDGLTGSDQLFGGSGNDTIIGGIWDGDAGVTYQPGRMGTESGTVDDRIFGGTGNDVLYGDDVAGTSTLGGNDLIDGGSGLDSIIAGAGNDTVYAGADNDTVLGGAGADSIFGQSGDDLLSGGDGADTIDGGLDNDNIVGGAGNDSLVGGAGNDTISGGAGSEIIFGGDGNDIVAGGTYDPATGIHTDDNEPDLMTGGLGDDRFLAEHQDFIVDFNTGNTGAIDDGNQTNNDFVDLGTKYYNDANLLIWNANNPDSQYANPLAWMRADQANDGVLNSINTTNGFTENFSFTIQSGGAATDASQLTFDNTNVVCFEAGVMIETDHGPVAAGDLNIGDLVVTRDTGLRPIRWVGRRVFRAAALEASPNLRPIRIARGALGRGLPVADLVVSPQHRVLVRSPIAQKIFGTSEVLVAAKQLCQIEGIDIATDVEEVSYVHFMFDDHQIVLSNGAETESMYTGAEALKSVGEAARKEIFAIFPDLRNGKSSAPARVLASGRMGRKLAVRHAQNSKPLVF